MSIDERLTLVIGVDKARSEGDESAVALRVGDKIHIVPDPFASELLKYLDSPANQQPDERLQLTVALVKLIK
jgi:hypothetical protein